LSGERRVTFEVGTWNCFGMGQRVLHAVTHWGAPSSARLLHAEVIAACARPDLLCVQELFSLQAQRFFDALAGPFDALVRDHNRVHVWPATLRGNGLGIASRRRLLGQSQHHFRAASSGWDRLARKGALYALVDVEGIAVDVLTCHLQAGYDAGAASVRAAQLVEVRRIIDDVGARDRPFIVCGDFNIDGLAGAREHAEYRGLVATLHDFTDLGAPSDLPTLDPHPERNPLAHAWNKGAPAMRLDYFFFRSARDLANGDAPRVSSTSLVRILDRPLAPDAALRSAGVDAHASDHFGLSATFEALGHAAR
jgi:endonuclease/exonuclease/phosphatase family metal-dependent hydrolase